MGNVYRPSLTRPVPRGAETIERDGERTARWRTSAGKLNTAEVITTARGDRIVQRSGKFIARFRDADGVVRLVATGCRDEVAARAKLAELERRAELVKSGVLSPAQDAVADHRRAPVAHHIDRYVESLRARGVTEKHIRGVRRRITEMFTACQFRSLRDVNRDAVERWLGTGANLGRSARTRNTFTIAAKSFLTWCTETDRLIANPLSRLARADEKADRRRVPRALTPDELQRLLDAARRRPLVEALKFNRGWRKGANGARLRPETRAKLEKLGLERALAYKVMILSGLRLGELAAVRVCDLLLGGPRPHVILGARHTKNRQDATLALRSDLAADLRSWIASNPGVTDRPLFNVSYSLLNVFNRDIAFANISKRDDRGRTTCIHSLRHSFATMLSGNGIAPRVAQAAMRHSTIQMTMATYVDPRLLDVATALDTLPELPLDASTDQASAKPA